ncbi:MAG: type II and III secretion system protein [Planctomycetota bacterium]
MNKIIVVTLCLFIIIGFSYAEDSKPAEVKPPEATPPVEPVPPPPPPPPPKPCPSPDATNKIGEIESSHDNLVSRFYYMVPERGKTLVTVLEKIKSSTGRIEYAEPLQMLILCDNPEKLQEMERLMEISNISQPQIMIEALIIERIIESDLQLGWETSWTRAVGSGSLIEKGDDTFHPGSYLQSLVPGMVGGFQGSTVRFNTTGKKGAIEIKLRMMLERGEAQILSSPRVMVSSGKKAIISSGQEIPYQQMTYPGGGAAPTSTIVYKSADIKLDVTPTLIGENNIRVVIKPEVRTISGYQTIQNVETPIFASRSAETDVMVTNGEEITIGGMVREEALYSEGGIPLLAQIPLLGYLFKRIQKDKNKTEIIFIIRPYKVKTADETVKPHIIPEKHKK